MNWKQKIIDPKNPKHPWMAKNEAEQMDARRDD